MPSDDESIFKLILAGIISILGLKITITTTTTTTTSKSIEPHESDNLKLQEIKSDNSEHKKIEKVCEECGTTEDVEECWQSGCNRNVCGAFHRYSHSCYFCDDD